VPLSALAPLARIEGAAWISLQMGPGRDELAHAPAGLAIFDAADRIEDFGDTAAIVEQLDLLVSVDTSVAHLGGALNKPTLMLLKSTSGMFWLMERDDSPWYPNALRIVRQSAPGDWDGVVERAGDLIRRFMQTRSLWEGRR
jgi:ADP-heptose:LPS heptosyltransferase